MNWIVLRRLYQIYEEGKTRVVPTLMNNPDIKYLLNHTRELYVNGDYIEKRKDFDKYYETDHKSNYKQYKEFLVQNGFAKPQTRFEEKDIQILMDISKKMNNGELHEIRDQIIKAEETVRGVSLMFFKNEKYLLNRQSLIDAVKQLLGINELVDEKDRQYKYVLECESPRLIVLCENIDFLKRPYHPRKNNVELWYAGGKNIDKLGYADIRGLKLFYSCDWDYDGLKIYEAVKKKIPEIQLLFPNGKPDSINTTEHKSLWRFAHDLEELSGLNINLFSSQERNLIQQLIDNNQWVIEESNDLIKMLEDHL